MKQGLRLTWVVAILLVPILLQAQDDSIRLACPLDEAIVVPPPKNTIHYNPPDLCIVLMSKPDTTVKAVINARVTNTEIDEDGKYGVVLFARIKGKDYYFWYTGMTRTIVRRNDNVKPGQALGYIAPGDKIEMLMFQFETPVDPTKYLDCKGVLKN
jgi:Peptidase family M23